MSKEDAKKFYDLVSSDEKVRSQVMTGFHHFAGIAKSHGCEFTPEEYYDYLHERTGMTKVGRSHDETDTDTCVCIFPSEPPRF